MSGLANIALPAKVKPPRFAVIGLGALGRLYAASLRLSGFEVYGLSRHGKPCCYQFQPTQSQPNQQHKIELVPPPLNHPLDYLLLTTKAQQALSAVQQWRPQFGPQTTLILLHNGQGTLAPLTALLGTGQRILQATSSHGALRTGEQLIHSGQGQTIIGPGSGPELTDDQRQQLLDALNSALPPAIWQQQIQQALWLKLAINAVINPLTAIHQCRNGALQQAHFQPQIEQLLDELALLYQQLDVPLQREQLHPALNRVIHDTAENYSSMNRDLAAGRDTEIEAISGFLLHQARQQGLTLAGHQQLYQQICAKQQQPN